MHVCFPCLTAACFRLTVSESHSSTHIHHSVGRGCATLQPSTRYAACTQPDNVVSTCACRAAGHALLSLLNFFSLPPPDVGNFIQRRVLAASINGDVATLQRLLHAGLDINGVIAASAHSVDYAVTPVMAATMAGKAEAVQLLLDHGADPNVQPHGMRSALCVAAQSGDADIVRMLLDAGAWPMAGPEWQPELPAVFAARAYWDALQQWSTDDPSGAFAKAEDYKRCFRLLLDAVALHISRFQEVCARSRLSGLRERAAGKGGCPDRRVWKVCL